MITNIEPGASDRLRESVGVASRTLDAAHDRHATPPLGLQR
jgi:hypothetical protein